MDPVLMAMIERLAPLAWKHFIFPMAEYLIAAGVSPEKIDWQKYNWRSIKELRDEVDRLQAQEDHP